MQYGSYRGVRAYGGGSTESVSPCGFLDGTRGSHPPGPAKDVGEAANRDGGFVSPGPPVLASLWSLFVLSWRRCTHCV